MEKDKIFFGEKGLTQTSANFYANMAKEEYQTYATTLDNMQFYTTRVTLLGTSESSLIRKGVDTVKNVSNILKSIAQLKSLIAWLREAIKAKETLINAAQVMDFEDFGIEVPEKPEREEAISKDDYIANMNIKQRNRYYYLEAYCATIGKYIHPDGTFALEREKLKKVMSEPNEVEGSGRDTLIYSRTPSLPLEEVEDTFMGLQQLHRSYQAELNSIKYEIENAVNQDIAAKNIAYSKALNEYKDKMVVANAKLEEKRKEAVMAASELKIIIPDSLKEIFDYVQSIGKK